MSFIKSATRKITHTNNVTDLLNVNHKNKYIYSNNGIADFNRLYLIGCPILPIPDRSISIPKNQHELIDANRRETVNRLHSIVSTMDRTDRSKTNLFYVLVHYLRFMDSKNISRIFSPESIKIYIDSLKQEYRDGTKGKTLSTRQGLLKTLIKELDAKLFMECESIFIKFPNDVEHSEPYTDSELKNIANALYVIYKNYSTHLSNNTIPDVFPLYPESNIQGVENLNLTEKPQFRRSTRYKTNHNLWKADLSRVAYLLTCLHTGINSSSLLKLKHSDIAEDPFKAINRSAYKLKTIKGRQRGKVNYTDVGFSKKAKIFIESWIQLSRNINGEDSDGFIFPNVHNSKLSEMTATSAGKINKTFMNLGLPSLTSKRFRQTKATLIMRSTESIIMVAQGLNNTLETASKYYANGDTVTTELSLASALYVRERAAQGGSLSQAVLESSYIFKDPVREESLKKIGKKLPNGLRCSENNGEKSRKLKDVLTKLNIASEEDVVSCYKFLDCFGCKFHAVVAEVNDIWLLLSFNDVILESLNRPSINSQPSKVLNRVYSTLQSILVKIKTEHSAIYNKAYEEYLSSPHPLWENGKDLELIMGIY
jgi:hypothetical protein